MLPSKVTPSNKYEENTKCLICNNILTINNSVTPLCKHTHCYNCFWKWAEKNDTCPFCREKLIPRDRKKELEMTNLLERRNEITNSLENLYNDYDIKKAHFNIINKKVRYLSNQKKNLKLIISELEYKYEFIQKKIKYKLKYFKKIQAWKKNPYLGIKYFEEIYKNNLKLKLNICFQEIKYNIKYKTKNRFWMNLNKRWNGRFQFGNNNTKTFFNNTRTVVPLYSLLSSNIFQDYDDLDSTNDIIVPI